MTVKEDFERWRKDKFPALNDIDKKGGNGWILIYGERAYTEGRKRTLEKIKGILYVNAPEHHLATEIPNAGILGGIDKYIDTELKKMEK